MARPGRRFHALASRLDGMQTLEDISESQEEAIAKISGSWAGDTAPAIRLLPDLVLAASLPGAGVPAGEVAVGAGAGRGAGPGGLSDTDPGPGSIDLADGDPHPGALGDLGAGRT